MNIRTTTLSLIIAASLGIAYTQTAKADSGLHDDASASAATGMRFGFAPNLVGSASSRRAVSPLSFGPHAGAVPHASSLIDPTFVVKTPPPPLAKPMPAMPVPSVQATVVQKPAQLPDAMKSIFGQTAPAAPPLIAKGAEPLTPPQGAGKPGANTSASKGVAGKIIHRSKPRGIGAPGARPLPVIAGYPSGYTPTPHLPGVGTGGQTVTDTTLRGTILRHH